MAETQIDITADGTLVIVKLTGFYLPDRALRALQEVRLAIVALGPRAGQHVTLYDLTDADISPAETITLMQHAFVETLNTTLAARRVAYCAPSALQRMQAKRLREGRGDIEVFADRETALAWLRG